MSMLPEYPSDPIAYLLRRRFGDAELTGPVSGLLQDEEKTQTQLYAEIQTYRTELQGLEEEELLALAYQEREKEARELEDVEEQSRSFNQPNANADFEYWAKFPLWTLDEAVALTLGKDPRVVTWPRIEEYAETSPFAARFDNLRRLVHRAKEAEQLTDLVSPADYIFWAKANHIAFPPELEKNVEAFSGQVPDWKALYEETKLQLATAKDELERHKAAEKPVGEREKTTFHKLILTMAIRGYGYDPRAVRSPISNDIAGDTQLLGISLDQDTVRSKLQKAFQEIGDQLPPSDEH